VGFVEGQLYLTTPGAGRGRRVDSDHLGMGHARARTDELGPAIGEFVVRERLTEALLTVGQAVEDAKSFAGWAGLG
jgi:hypothetical protein